MADALDLQRLSADTVKMFLEKLGSQLLSIVIFGSQVDGRAFGDSDVDILIVSEDRAPYSLLEKVCRAINMELTLKYANKVNCIPFQESDIQYMMRRKHPFLIGIFQNNILAYDPKGYFQKTFVEIRKQLEKGEIKIYGKSGLVFVK